MRNTGGMAAYAYPGAPPADPTAVMGRRIGAFFIDAALALAVFVLIMLPLATQRTVNETLDLPGCHRTFNDSGNQVRCDNRVVFQIGDTVYEADAGPTFILDVAFVFLYFGLLPALAGATLGKALTGIRVVDRQGNRAGLGKSLVRWIIFLVDGPLTLYLCGLITSLASKGHRRLGDMGADTYVVAKSSVGQPVILPSAAPVYAGVPPQPGAPPPPAPAGPQWDPARNAYVQWDPSTGTYRTWDEQSQTWR